MDETYVFEDLENLVLKDKEYRLKMRKIITIVLLIIITAIIITISLIFILREVLRKKGGKIICYYKTTKDN